MKMLKIEFMILNNENDFAKLFDDFALIEYPKDQEIK